MAAEAQSERTLLTGGDPYAKVEPPNKDLFFVWIDENGAALEDYDPEDADEDDEPAYKRELDFLPAEDLERIARAILVEYEEFRWILKTRISFRWKRDGGKVNGRARLGACQKLTGLLRDELGDHFLIWMAANHWAGTPLTAWELEACMYHQLCHVGVNDLHPHDFEGFGNEINRYGFWRRELQIIRQLDLFGGAS